LQTERKVKRPGRGGTVQTMTLKPLSSQSLHSAMKEFRTLFNHCRKYYNDEDTGKILIPNYPFSRWKFPKISSSGSRKALDLEILKRLRDYSGRREFERDMFFLSFYLVGINPADLFELSSNEIKDGRLSYCRKKTRGRRADQAYISIAIPKEAMAIMEKYRQPYGENEWRWQNYGETHELVRRVSRGLGEISKELGATITWYAARHTWATLARNECGYSIDDVAFALNHSSGRVTDKYIRKDYTLIDRMNKRVIALVIS
jgi:integrase